MPTVPRNRLDHILPQGYLEGFTNPQGKLSVLDTAKQRWFETLPKSVAAVRGFYDYSEGAQPDQTADEAFQEFEDNFPALRREIVANRFSNWIDHIDFLLRYAQMMRARSKLFREQTIAQFENSLLSNDGAPADPASQTHIVASPETELTLINKPPNERREILRNITITLMRSEIAAGAGLFANLHWCLRFTFDWAHPVITADDALMVRGEAPDVVQAFHHPETWVFFPLCSQACLIGNPIKFDVQTDEFHPVFLRAVQTHYLESTCRFVYSPLCPPL